MAHMEFDRRLRVGPKSKMMGCGFREGGYLEVQGLGFRV